MGKLYSYAFLSGAYQNKKWEFVFWYIRTEPDTKTIPTRRVDAIKKVKWHKIYHRRIAIGSNWQFRYSSSIEIDVELSDRSDKRISISNGLTSATGTIIEPRCYYGNGKWYTWLNSESWSDSSTMHDNEIQEHSLFTSSEDDPSHKSNICDFNFDHSFLNDYYIIGVKRYYHPEKTSETITIISRGNEDKTAHTIIDISSDAKIKMVNEKWTLV